MKTYDINPVGKPRMTQSDKWKIRSRVKRYWDFKYRIRNLKISIPDSGSHIIFYIPMPESWSKKKKKCMVYEFHQSIPDVDNLLKGLLDAVFDNDSHIYDVRVTKRWGWEGRIIVADISEVIFNGI